MKPFSLPDMKTRPRIDLSRAPSSTRSMIMASSSSGRRPSEFWLSPSRSNTAQAMPCMSTEKRQSRNAFMSSMALYLAGFVSMRHAKAYACAASPGVDPRLRGMLYSAAALWMARALCPAVM